MQSLLLFVAALWLLTAFVHGVLGTREIALPVVASNASSTARYTSEVCWHLITLQLVAMGAFAIYVSFVGAHVLPFAVLSATVAAGCALLFLGFGAKRFGNPWRMPQWVLFVPLAALSLAAPYASAFSWSMAASIARIAAASLLVALALLHVAWALGSSFPAASHASLAAHVIGVAPRGQLLPSKAATWLVAIGLLLAAVCVVALGFETGSSRVWLQAAVISLVAIFSLRGLLGFFEPALRPAIRRTPYLKWSRGLYSPLSLLLALLIGVGAQS
jgi:energy-converting hydrogenase Eha subunit A